MIDGINYYQFTPEQYNSMYAVWRDEIEGMLAYDSRNGGIYYAAEGSAFDFWLDDHLGDVLDLCNIEDVEAGPFSPLSGESGGN